MDKVKYLLYGVFSYLGLNHETFGILMVLMLMDSIVGAVKAARLGEEVKFKIMLWGISMKLIFLMIPVTLALMAKSLGYDFTLAIHLVISILTVAEGYSILGNIYMAKNRVKIKKTDVVSSLLILIRKMIGKVIKNLLGKLEDEEIK